MDEEKSAESLDERPQKLTQMVKSWLEDNPIKWETLGDESRIKTNPDIKPANPKDNPLGDKSQDKQNNSQNKSEDNPHHNPKDNPHEAGLKGSTSVENVSEMLSSENNLILNPNQSVDEKHRENGISICLETETKSNLIKSETNLIVKDSSPIKDESNQLTPDSIISIPCSTLNAECQHPKDHMLDPGLSNNRVYKEESNLNQEIGSNNGQSLGLEQTSEEKQGGSTSCDLQNTVLSLNCDNFQKPNGSPPTLDDNKTLGELENHVLTTLDNFDGRNNPNSAQDELLCCDIKDEKVMDKTVEENHDLRKVVSTIEKTNHLEEEIKSGNPSSFGTGIGTDVVIETESSLSSRTETGGGAEIILGIGTGTGNPKNSATGAGTGNSSIVGIESGSPMSFEAKLAKLELELKARREREKQLKTQLDEARQV